MSDQNRVVTFGEVLMRLSPPENRKLQQSNKLDFFFGGTEMNVAASLAKFGMQVSHVTNLSDDIIGEAALTYIKQFGIDVSHANKVEHPLGLYFLETGSAMRSSQISYNRLQGSFAHITPKDVDWETILGQGRYFHWTGISPAISKGAYQTLKNGLLLAGKKNMIITADPAYRSNLWRYGRNGQEILSELIDLSTILIGGVNEINEILKSDFSRDTEGFIEGSKEIMKVFPSITKVFDKVRTGVSASWQKIYGQAWTGNEYIRSGEYEITTVIDRIGTGDAFAAGIIYGLEHYDDQQSLNYATAACALKHTILGDINLVSVEEVLRVVNGDVSGRIIR